MKEIPLIFDAGPQEDIPEGFNAVRIVLDGTVRSDLNWTAQIDRANALRDRGYRIFWEMDLGLLSRLELSLSDEQQFRSLSIAVKHFADAVWPKFSDETVGLCLYRGTGNYSLRFPWDEERREALRLWLQEAFKTPEMLEEELRSPIAGWSTVSEKTLQSTAPGQEILRLFCRDCLTHYLEMLTAGLPAYLSLYSLVDMTGVLPERHCYQLAHREVWEDMWPIVRGAPRETTEFTWDDRIGNRGFLGRILPNQKENDPFIGLCLPSRTTVAPSQLKALDSIIAQLRAANYSFRVLAENFLSSDWEELDYIVVLSDCINPTAVRMLHGFCAAGGTVMHEGQALGLSSEVPFDLQLLKSTR